MSPDRRYSFNILPEVKPLSKADRQKFPHKIYEIPDHFRDVLGFMMASYYVMKLAGFPIAVDVEGNGSRKQVAVRTGTVERHEQTMQSALVQGLAGATERALEDGRFDEEKSIKTADKLLHGLIDNEELYGSFTEYYGGLRWGLDQERFVSTLFVHGTDFNRTLVQDHLTSTDVLYGIADDVGLNLIYEQRSSLSESSPQDIFTRYPELDYGLLHDDTFRESENGKRLEAAYAKMSGEILARQHKNPRRIITEDGHELIKPQIPLSHHPIIESLIIDEIETDRPQREYSFGPEKLTGIIIDSDSKPAHESLVRYLTTRFPKGEDRGFGRASEFQHKHGIIATMLRKYNDVSQDETSRALLKEDILAVLDAYTGEGNIAQSVRQETSELQERGYTYIVDPHEIKGIVSDILTIAVTASDPELTGKAEELATHYAATVPAIPGDTQPDDVLALNRIDLTLMLFESFSFISPDTDPEVIRRIATIVFGNQTFAEQFRNFAIVERESKRLRSQPEVLAALRKWTDLSLKGSLLEETPEKTRAKSEYEQVVKPSDDLARRANEQRWEMILDLLEGMANSGQLNSQNTEMQRFFDGMIKKVGFRGYKMRELPEGYHRLMNLAKKIDLPEDQRGTILWHTAEQFRFTEEGGYHLLPEVILDIYEAALGPVDAIMQPNERTSHSLAAAVNLIGQNRGVFTYAPDFVEELAEYKTSVMRKAEQILSGHAITGESGSTDLVTIADAREATATHHITQTDALKNIQSVMRELGQMEEYYAEYLHLLDVKRFSHVYYPWILAQFGEFWGRLQWEVGEGQRPTHAMRELHRIMSNLVENKLMIQDEYLQSFDVVEEGHIDLLIKEGYDRMVTYSDMHYNNTVWQVGIPFVNTAIRNMPESVKDQIVAKYQGTEFADYVERVHGEHNRKQRIL